MRSAAIIAAATILSASYAATVRLQETPCIGNTTQLESFDIEIGSLQTKDLADVCGLEIVSAEGVDVNSVECQAFKDAEGKDPGSAKFTKAKPALIATNPVQEKSILCTSNGAVVSRSTTGTTGTTLVPSATGGLTPSGNATAPSNTGTPKPSSSSTPPSSGNAAGRVGMGIGAIAMAFAALLL